MSLFYSKAVCLTFLSKTQASLSSAVLQSSSTLGTGKPLTFEERQAKEEDALVKKALVGQTGKRKRNQDVFSVHDNEDLSGDDGEEEEERPRKIGKAIPDDGDEADVPSISPPEVVVVEAPENPPPKKVSENVAVGSALQRNPDGSIAAPKIRQRTKPKGKLVSVHLTKLRDVHVFS